MKPSDRRVRFEDKQDEAATHLTLLAQILQTSAADAADGAGTRK